MMDLFTLLAPLLTASLPTAVSDARDIPDAIPTAATIAHFATGIPVTQTIEVYSLTPSRHFCRVMCPFCGGEHSHGVELAFLQDTPHRGFGPRKAHCTRLDRRDGSGGDYWIALDEWVRGGGHIEDKVRLKEGEMIWL